MIYSTSIQDLLGIFSIQNYLDSKIINFDCKINLGILWFSPDCPVHYHFEICRSWTNQPCSREGYINIGLCVRYWYMFIMKIKIRTFIPKKTSYSKQPMEKGSQYVSLIIVWVMTSYFQTIRMSKFFIAPTWS